MVWEEGHYTATEFSQTMDKNVKTLREETGVSLFSSFRKMGTQKILKNEKSPHLFPEPLSRLHISSFFPQKCLVQTTPAPSHHQNTGTYLWEGVQNSICKEDHHPKENSKKSLNSQKGRGGGGGKYQ